MDNYRIERKIGSGNFAKVFLAVHTPTGQQVALKLVDKRENRSTKTLRRINSEITNMKLLQGHPNIVSIFDTFETPKHSVIVMEYIPGGELFDYVQKKEGMNETSAQEMFINIVHGVQHCHRKGVAHRDLKLENILLDKDHQPKIADFGFSKNIPSFPLTASSVGSPLYSSPEIIQGKPYQGPECDVWSLGVILYTMLTATMPFDDSNIGQFLVKVENGDYPEPCVTSDAVKDLISRMLDPISTTRFTLKEILSHPWMTGLCKKASPLLPNKTRRQAICYESAEYINKELQDFNKCSCSCHHSCHHSILSKHCEDCRDIQANNPETLLGRNTCLSSNSSLSSSGYGSELYSSEIGSHYWDNTSSPHLSHLDLLGLELLPLEGLRASGPRPRKSSAGTIGSNSTITSKTSHHRCSVPVLTPMILSEDSEDDNEDNDDIVFV